MVTSNIRVAPAADGERKNDMNPKKDIERPRMMIDRAMETHSNLGRSRSRGVIRMFSIEGLVVKWTRNFTGGSDGTNVVNDSMHLYSASIAVQTPHPARTDVSKLRCIAFTQTHGHSSCGR